METNELKEGELFDPKTIAISLVEFLFNNQRFYMPIYIDEIKTEDDADKYLGYYPVVYVWNENRETSSFTVSINVATVVDLLETVMPQEHSEFILVRNFVIDELKNVFSNTIVSFVKKTGQFPSQLFGREGVIHSKDSESDLLNKWERALLNKTINTGA